MLLRQSAHKTPRRSKFKLTSLIRLPPTHDTVYHAASAPFKTSALRPAILSPAEAQRGGRLIEDGDAPDGWLLVQSGRRLTGLVGTQGLVPLTFLEEIEAAPDESASDAAATEAPGAAAPEAANDGGSEEPLD